MHLTNNTSTKLNSSHYPVWYHSLSYSNKVKGVDFGFHRNVFFQLSDMLAGPHRRFLFIKGTLAKIYSPNQDQINFLSSLNWSRSHNTSWWFKYSIGTRGWYIPGFSSIPCKPLVFICKHLHNTQLINTWQISHPKWISSDQTGFKPGSLHTLSHSTSLS